MKICTEYDPIKFTACHDCMKKLGKSRFIIWWWSKGTCKFCGTKASKIYPAGMVIASFSDVRACDHKNGCKYVSIEYKCNLKPEKICTQRWIEYVKEK